VNELETKVDSMSDQLHTQSRTISSLQTENKLLQDQLGYLKRLIEGLGLGALGQIDLPKLGAGSAFFGFFVLLIVSQQNSAPTGRPGRVLSSYDKLISSSSNPWLLFPLVGLLAMFMFCLMMIKRKAA